MKKNIIALTVLMALSATAQAEESNHTLLINGEVTIDSCVFEDLTADGKTLTLDLDKVSIASISKNPSDIQKSLDASSGNTLVCPTGLETVRFGIDAQGAANGYVLNNIAKTDAAQKVGFKVKAAFGEDLTTASPWIDFSVAKSFDATPDADGKVAVNFGANYALTGEMREATPGHVAAELPFTISYN